MRGFRFIAIRVAAAVGLSLAWTAALADSWSLPERRQYVSADGQVRVTVTPRPLESQLDFFKDKTGGKDGAGQRVGAEQKHATALLEKRDASGRWRAEWKIDLVNDVSPVGAAVANDGRYFVTWDNWHSKGYGPDVVVIYDAHGTLARKLSLADFLPAGYIAAVPRSVSSIWWSTEDHVLDSDGETLTLRLAPPGERDITPESAIPLRLRLADGSVLSQQGPEWTRAMQKVGELEKARQARWDALRARRASPLSPPAGTSAKAWRAYMVELRARMGDHEDKPVSGAVLQVEEGGYGGDSADGIESQLNRYDMEFVSGFVFVSPDSARLADVLARRLRAAKTDEFRGARIAFVGTPADRDKVVSAAQGSGATIEWIDQSAPVPGKTLPADVPQWFVEADH